MIFNLASDFKYGEKNNNKNLWWVSCRAQKKKSQQKDIQGDERWVEEVVDLSRKTSGDSHFALELLCNS